uniref:Mannan-binding lectin serine protease 1 n=1 Tax=Denticeps clupeoides TaxID=299321 RepID=A0AAY4C853_9TELE
MATLVTANVALILLVLCSSSGGTRFIHLTDMYGTIHSPSFPESYPKDSEVQWNISVPEGYQIKLYFKHFELEPSYLCEYDYVKVLSDQMALAVFCGKEGTDTEQVPGDDVITSAGNTLSLVFHSDFSNEERFSGFQAHYSAVDVDECRDRNDEELTCDHFCHNYIGGYYCSCRYGYLLHADNRTCKVECSDSVYTERTGVLSSADFPRPYPKSSDCLYRIELEEGFIINLTFHDTFDIEDHPDVTCPYDYIKIQAGKEEFGPFCGNRSPRPIQTRSSIVQVLFHSDNSGENLGWKLSYTSTGSECPVPTVSSFGHLEPAQQKYIFKDHVLVTCDTGYALLKDGEQLEHFQIECQRNGSWSSNVPPCKTTYSCNKKGKWRNAELGTRLPSCLPACGQPAQAFPAVQKRIVGGRMAPVGQFPWQVRLTVEDVSRVPVERWFGSGALLSDSWVLTAAHVLRSLRREPTVIPVSPHNVHIHVGLHDLRSPQLASNYSVQRIILHPEFDVRNYNHDIALIQLANNVTLSHLVMPICLPAPWHEGQPLPPSPNSLGLVAGWGITTTNTSAPDGEPGAVADMLQYVKLPVVPQDECVESYASRSRSYNITENMFCAGFYEGGRDTCQGDSGGAFVMEDPQTGLWGVQGLVSWGGPEECGSRRVYGVYTRVAKYAHWLHSHLGRQRWW